MLSFHLHGAIGSLDISWTLSSSPTGPAQILSSWAINTPSESSGEVCRTAWIQIQIQISSSLCDLGKLLNLSVPCEVGL